MTHRTRAAALVLALLVAACSGSGATSASTSSGATTTSTPRSTTTTTSTTTTSTSTTTVVAEPEATATTLPPTTETPPTDPPATEPPDTFPAKPFPRPSANVYMNGRTFFPNAPVIDAGGTIYWTNQSQEVHNVVGDGFNSGEVAPGGSYSRVFGAPGHYSYRCTFHPEMTGQIDVQ